MQSEREYESTGNTAMNLKETGREKDRTSEKEWVRQSRRSKRARQEGQGSAKPGCSGRRTAWRCLEQRGAQWGLGSSFAG